MKTAIQHRMPGPAIPPAGVEHRCRRSHVQHARRMLLMVFVFCDTTTVRALMALASIFFAVGCIPDAIWPDSLHLFNVPSLHWRWINLAGWDIHTPGPLGVFSRPLYSGMRQLAPDWAWGVGFSIHAAGVVWRFLDVTPRVYWALAINALGFSLWFLSTLLMTWQVGEFVPSQALEWVMVGAMFIALFRTGLNEEKTTP